MHRNMQDKGLHVFIQWTYSHPSPPLNLFLKRVDEVEEEMKTRQECSKAPDDEIN